MTNLFGDGLTVSTAGLESSFFIHTRDEFGNTIVADPFSPQLPFNIEVVKVSEYMFKGSTIRWKMVSGSYSNGSFVDGLIIPGRLVSNHQISGYITSFQNGSFVASYLSSLSGSYFLVIDLGSVRILNQTFFLHANEMNNSMSKFQLSATSLVAGAETSQLVVHASDAYGNNLTSGGIALTVAHSKPYLKAIEFVMDDIGDGSYMWKTNLITAGEHVVNILRGSSSVLRAPMRITVRPEHASSSFSSASGSGTTVGSLGSLLDLYIILRDRFQNIVAASASSSDIPSIVVTYATSGNTEDVTPVPDSQTVQLAGFLATYLASELGFLNVDIKIGAIDIIGSPFAVSIVTGAGGIVSHRKSFLKAPVVHVGEAGLSMLFTIQSVETSGEMLWSRTKGGLTFFVATSPSTSGSVISSFDRNDGTYQFPVMGTAAGTYTMVVMLDDPRCNRSCIDCNVNVTSCHISDSPFNVQVVPAGVSAEHSIMVGNFLSVSTAGVWSSIRIDARDRFSNRLTFSNSPGLPFEVEISGPSEVKIETEDFSDGTFVYSYEITVSGAYSVQHRLSTAETWVVSPESLTVLPAEVSRLMSKVNGAGLSVAVAGESSEFRLLLEDKFGNEKGRMGLGFSMSPYSGTEFSVYGVDDDSGWLIVKYVVTRQANYSLQISINSFKLSDAPFTISVQAGKVHPASCTAFGNGVKEILAADLASFTIASRDAFSNTFTLGGFSFKVAVTDSYSLYRGTCNDKGTGEYLCNYMTTISGSLSLAVTYSSFPIKGSPFVVKVNPNVANATNSIVYGHSISLATAGISQVVKLTARDRAGNYLRVGWDNFAVNADSSTSKLSLGFAVKDFKNGTYVMSFMATLAGAYKLGIIYQNVHVHHSPYSFTVFPAPVGALSSKLEFRTSYPCESKDLQEPLCATVNPQIPYSVSVFDRFGNVQPDQQMMQLNTTRNGVNTVSTYVAVREGSFASSFSGTHSGSYQVIVSIDDKLVQGKIHSIYLEPLLFSAGGFFEAAGPGLTLTTAGTQVSFQIRARDYWGNQVSTLNPMIQLSCHDALDLLVDVNQTVKAEQSSWRIGMWVNQSGPIALSVEVLGAYARRSPFSLRVLPGLVSAEMSTASGPGIEAALFKVQMSFDFMPRDRFGNLLENIDLSNLFIGIHYSTQGTKISGNVQKSTPLWKATYIHVNPSPFITKMYVSVMINGNHIGSLSMPFRGRLIGWKGSPFIIPIVPGISSPSPANSFSKGVATSIGIAGIISSFNVQMVDDYGLYLKTGGRALALEMIKGSFFLRFSTENSPTSPNTIIDKNDGSFEVQFQISVAGNYRTGVLLDAMVIGEGPFYIKIIPGNTSATHSTVLGNGATMGIAGVDGSFVIEARDRFSNLQVYRPSEQPPFTVKFDGPTTGCARIQDSRDSTYVAVYSMTVSGIYSMQISVQDCMDQNVLSLHLFPAVLYPGTSFIRKSDLSNLMAGNMHMIPIQVLDFYSNIILAPNTDSALSEVGCNMQPRGKIDVFAVKSQFQMNLDMTASGKYSLVLSVGGQIVADSPYEIVVQASALSASESRVLGNGLFGVVAAETAYFDLYPLDRFGNLVPTLSFQDIGVSLQANRSGFEFTVLESTPTVQTISYSPLFPCNKCKLSVKIRGKHVKDSPFTIDITPAPPPYLQSATFESHLAGANIVFDQATDVGNGIFSGIFDCGRLLDTSTFLLVGQGSKCSWTSTRSFSISFGQNAQVRKGSPIAVCKGLLQNAVRNSKAVSGSVFLLLPTNVVKPALVINAPLKIASCDALQIDASSSYGNGGRAMVFSWGLALGPINRGSVMNVLSALPSEQSVVDLPKSSLLPGETYVFTLTVRNFIDMETSASVSVTIAGDETPQLYIAGNSVFTVRGSKALTLRGRASISPCAISQTAVAFTWTQAGGPQFLTWPSPKTANTASLYLPPNSLAVGQTYVLRLNGVLQNNPSAYSFAEVTITVAASPMIAVIQGGNRSYSENIDLELDASGSIDPDSSDEPFSFAWQCEPSPCFEDRTGIMAQDSAKIVIPGGSFAAGTKIVFTTLVSKDPGPRVCSTSIMIEIVQAGSSVVKISIHGAPKSKVNADNRLVLLGHVATSNANLSCTTPQYSWSLLAGDIDLKDASIRSTSLISPNLVLNPSTLTPGQEYVLKIQAACSSETAGEATAIITVNMAPVGGSFTVTPTSGLAFHTTFSLSCNRWVDEVEDFPLQYFYHIAKAGNLASLQPLSGAVIFNKLDVVLTSSDDKTHFLIAQACDNLGACSNPPSVQVNVFEAPLSMSAASLFDSLVISAEGVGDTEKIVGAAGAILSLMNTRRRRSSTGDATLRGKIMDVLTSASASSVLTVDLVSFISSSVDSAMNVSSHQVESFHLAGMSLVETLTTQSIDLGSISMSAVGYLGNSLSGAIKAEAESRKNARRRDVAPVSQVYTRVQAAMTQLGHARVKNSVAFEASLTLETELFEQTVGRFDPVQLAEGEVPLSVHAASSSGATMSSFTCRLDGFCDSVVLPSFANPSASVKDVQYMVWKMQLYSKDDEFTVSYTNSLQLLYGPKVIEQHKMQSPAIFSLGITPGKVDRVELASGDYTIPSCEFWDSASESWSSTGCLAIGTDIHVIRCACYHLTDFVAMIRPVLKDLGRSDEFLTENGYLVQTFTHHYELLVAACVAFFLGVILAGLGYYVDHKRKGKSTRQLHPIMFSRSAHRASAGAGEPKISFRFRSLFLNLWSRRSAQMLKTQHGILGVFFRTSRDSYDRAARVTTLFVYVIAAMVINILWFGEFGFTDDYQILPGILTGFILIPLQPVYALIFRLVETPSAEKKRMKRELKAERDDIEKDDRKRRKEQVKQLVLEREERKKQEALEKQGQLEAKALVRQARRGRVEVATNVETVSLQEGQDFANNTSDIVAGSSMGIDANNQGWGALTSAGHIKGAQGRQGPRTPEGHRPRPSADLRAIENNFQRPSGLPAVRQAFDDSVDQSHYAESPVRGMNSKHSHKNVEKYELPREFLYFSYGTSLAVHCFLIFMAFQYGTTFVFRTQLSWLVATVTTLIFEFVFWQPLALVTAAFLEVRSHLYEVMRPPMVKQEMVVFTPPESPMPEVPMTPPPPSPPPSVPSVLGHSTIALVELLMPYCTTQMGRKLSLENLNCVAASCPNPYAHSSRMADRDEDIEDFFMTLSVEDISSYVSLDTLLNNVEMDEMDRLCSKFFLRHPLGESKIAAAHIRVVMRGIMPDEQVNMLVKKRPIFTRAPSQESKGSFQRVGSTGSKATGKGSVASGMGRAWARLRSSGTSGSVLKVITSASAKSQAATGTGLTQRRTSAGSVNEVITEEEDSGDTLLTFEDFKKNVDDLIIHLKIQSGEMAPPAPPEKRFKQGVGNLTGTLNKDKQQERVPNSLFARVSSFSSIASQVLSKLRKETPTPDASVHASQQVSDFQRVNSFARIASAGRMASIASQDGLVLQEALNLPGAQDGSQVALHSATVTVLHRRFKAAIAKLDMRRAKDRARTQRAIIMYDVEPELLQLPVLSLEHLQEIDFLPGTPSEPSRPGTSSRAGTTPRATGVLTANSDEFSRPPTGTRPGTGDVSRPSTTSSAELDTRGRDSPLISKSEWA